MSGKDQTPAARAGGEVTQSNADEVDAFLAKVRAAPAPLKAGERGRLIFAMDATMSRQPTWDTACRIQAEMFDETAKIGGLDVQLVYFRGFRECRASRWVADAMQLADLMTQVSCRGGHTQIGKVLKHVHGETEKAKVDAVVYVGDCMEESVDRLCHLAGQLSILGVPVFMFQEGRNMIAERTFREIARLTGGAYCRFDAGSAGQLRQLLSAVAVYAAGGRKALADLSSARGGEAALLLEQLK
jgi:hypothetical protein